MSTDDQKYDALIYAIQDAINEVINEHGGTVRSSVLEGALGFHLSCTFDRYPQEVRPQVIEHFCKTLREAPVAPASLN